MVLVATTRVQSHAKMMRVGVSAHVSDDVILVVDNDESIRRSLRRLLTAHGYEVHEASDGTAALEQASRLRPRVVIIDLHMHSLNGLEIARAIKANSSMSGTCLIAFSASVPDWDDELQLFDQVVEKPAPADILLKAIAEATKRVV